MSCSVDLQFNSDCNLLIFKNFPKILAHIMIQNIFCLLNNCSSLELMDISREAI